jgi:hypothetical protein
MTLNELIPVLQVAIGPVILISGVALLLLTMTNRLARTIDRSRQLVDQHRQSGDVDRQRLDAELKILWRRARLLQMAITLAVAGALFACALVITIFIGVLMQLDIAMEVVVLFISCMTAVIASLVLFIRDVDLGLHALRLELEITQGSGRAENASPPPRETQPASKP